MEAAQARRIVLRRGKPGPMEHVHIQAAKAAEQVRGHPARPESFGALQGLATISEGPAAPPETTVLVAGRPLEPHAPLGSLRSWVIPFAGVPAPTLAFVRDRPDVALYNLRFNAAPTSELALGLLLAAARAIAAADTALRQGHWRGRQDDAKGYLLAGKTVTILGYGTIGRRVGDVLKALGMDVIGVRRTATSDEPGVMGVERLDEALSRSHALVVTAPATLETLGLIGSRELALLKPPRLVVNVGRAAIIDEESLFVACRDEVVGGAGIDVWYHYPQGDDGPVWPSQFAFQELPNVVMSPHRAGDTDQTEVLRLEALVQLLRAILTGEPVRPVDIELGY